MPSFAATGRAQACGRTASGGSPSAGARLVAAGATLALHAAVLAGAIAAMDPPPVLQQPAPSDLVVITIRHAMTPKPSSARVQTAPVPAAQPPAAAPETSATRALALPAVSGTKPAASPPPLLVTASASPAAPPAKPEQVIAQKAEVTPSADLLPAYRSRLWQAIFANRPPGIAGEGRVDVGFRIDRGGNLISAEVAHSSGNALLDRLALRGVRKAAPFPPPPVGLDEKSLAFIIPVRFGRTPGN